jgi:hypothetical protein
MSGYISRIKNRADFARYAATEAVQAHLDAARRRADAATRDVEWLENLLATKLDRRHAGLSLPCEVCAGPCQIDVQPGAGVRCVASKHIPTTGASCSVCGAAGMQHEDDHPGGDRRG